MKLPLKSINLDFQSEEDLDQEIVEAYVLALQCGETLAPVTVYSDGASYWLFDGFHRVKAARIQMLQEIEAEIIEGTDAEMEARWQEALQRIREELRTQRQS